MTATVESPAPRQPLRRRVEWLTAVRLLIVILCTVVAFGYTWIRLVEDVRAGSDIGFGLAVAVVAVFAATGIALRHGGELPIYDRQTDIIVGLLGLAVTGGLLGLLVLRYPYEYEYLHFDLLAAPLFLMSVSVMAFGLRPVFRFWPAWLLLLAAYPHPYFELKTALGGDAVAAGAAMLPVAAAAAAIGCGRTWRRAVAGGIGAALIGALVLAVLRALWPHASFFVYQTLPPVLAVAVTTAVVYLFHRRWSTLRPLDRPTRPLTAKRSRSALITTLVATALVAVIPLPKQYTLSFPMIPGLLVADAPIIPEGWLRLNEHDYPWAPRFIGPGTSWTRRMLLAEHGNPSWDKESRRRRIAVDIVRATDRQELQSLPIAAVYDLKQPRVSPPLGIDIGHGIVAKLNIVVDERNLLSWTTLGWDWRGPDGYEWIVVTAADNHLPDALFPEPKPSVTRNVSNLLHQILRGNAVQLNPYATGEPDLEFKDQDMLATVARAMAGGVGAA